MSCDTGLLQVERLLIYSSVVQCSGTELTLNMTTFILDRSASNYVPSRETLLQERSHKMPLRQKRDAEAQMS